MQSVEEVYAAIGREVKRFGTEHLAIGEAGGRILGAAVTMKGDSPPFDRSQLDGFAVRSSDAATGAKLRLVGRQDAGGAVWGGRVGEGQCVAINTGAIVPAGADGVLMVEYSRAIGETVEVKKAVAAGYGVQKRGSDARAGEEVLEAGRKLGAAQLAAAVLAGVGEVEVVRKVKVALLVTGDELVAAGGALGGGQIPNSNGPMLKGLVGEALGACGEVLDLGVCGDVEGELRGRLGRALAEADVVVVTGGMSMGTKDLVPPVLKALGAEFHVEKVRMKPGKPFVFGTIGTGAGRKYVAGLPGNPVSAFVTFQLFVREMLGVMSGEAREAGGKRLVHAEAAGVFEANGDREFYQPCVVRRSGTGLVAEGLKWRGSGDVFTLARANGLVKRVVDAGKVEIGEAVEVLLLSNE